jgi:hypothetical protein
MSKHDCKSRSRNIPDLIDGKLSPDEEREMQLHLERCARCAAEEAKLRQFMHNELSPLRESRQDVDWGSFSMRLNEEIDRRHHTRKTRSLLSPSVLLPIAAAFVAILAFWMLSRPTTSNAPSTQPAYAVTLDRSDIFDLTTDDMRSLPLGDVTLSLEEIPAITIAGPDEDPVIIENAALTAEVQSALAENIGFANLVEASFEYFSTQEVLNAMDDIDLALLASTLEIENIDVQ